jgi:hypothetical protein
VTTPSIEVVDTGRAKEQICWVFALFAFSFYRALRGHSIDWFFYTLLGGFAASSVATLAHDTRWQKPMTVLSYGLMAVTCVGIAFGLYVMG